LDGRLAADSLSTAIAKRYGESAGEAYGMTAESFQQMIAGVVEREAAALNKTEQVAFVGNLRIADLTLARACAAGNEVAWEAFLGRFRSLLYGAAYRITKDEATGRELADELYADLYGVSSREAKRRSKLECYTGRGSLDGWLRTVLSRQFVNRYRSRSREVSLEEQLEAGAGFAAAPATDEHGPDQRLGPAIAGTLMELDAEERFLLSSWYLDQRTLADIGRQLLLHESTISRRLDRLTKKLRRRVRERLRAAGLGLSECDELLLELDVRDLNVNVAASLKQETGAEAFHK
jgi:RNA polymerase sigma-70 factor, ECF subfamily